MSTLNPILRFWFTPKLPEEHIVIPEGQRFLRNYFLRWLIHPVKRRIAKIWLWLLQEIFGLKVIAVTGSAGKTTTKEMIAAIVKQKGKTVATFANIDPVYNIPTAILRTSPGTKYLVLEMGVEFPGEMDFYLWCAKPLIGVVTNIHPTHTQFFKNEQGVAKEKGKLIASLPKEGFAVLNKENRFCRAFAAKTKAKPVWFGEGGEVYAEEIQANKESGNKFTLVIGADKIVVHSPVPGTQIVSNSLAAASVGYALGFSAEEIKGGLEDFKLSEHRMSLIRLSSGALVLDDSYNSNPAALKETLFSFTELARGKTKIAVLGDMLELGELEEASHKEAGELVAQLKIDKLIAVGNAARLMASQASKTLGDKNVMVVSSYRQVLPILKPFLTKDSAVVIKGSRSIGLERVVSALS